MIPKQFQAEYPYLSAVLVEMRTAERGEPPQHKATKAEIGREIEAVNASAEALLSLIGGLFGGTAEGDELMRFSMAAYRYLGVNDEVRRFMGRIWAELMRSWRNVERKRFLQLTVSNQHDVFQALDFGSEMLRHVCLTAEEALPWFAAAHRLVGNDLMQRGFWACVQNFCTTTPNEAVAVMESWLRQSPDAAALDVIANMLGWLRLCISPDDPAFQRFASFEQVLQAGHPAWRGVYIRSWARIAEQVDEATAVAMRGLGSQPGGEDETSWIYLLSSVAQADRKSWSWVLRELRGAAKPNLSSKAKYWVAAAALHGIEAGEHGDADEWRDLLSAILPISLDEAAFFWQNVEHNLVTLAESNVDSMRLVMKALGAKSGATFLQLIRKGEFTYLLSVLARKGIHHLVCGDLCFGEGAQSRQLGLLLLAESGVQGLHKSVIDAATALHVELLLLEAQRFAIDYSALARLHACLAHRVDQIGGDLLFLFYDEVAIQALNTHAYRQTLSKEASDHEYLRAILRDVDERLGDTGKASESPALQMEVPHRRAADTLSRQRMAREVAKGVQEHSVFLNLIQQVTLLYGGRTWRTFRPDGTLSEASEMKVSSTTVEVPRLELLDPEGMQIRRLQASARITILEKQLAQDGQQ
jgi:hypothetical protein